MINASKLQSPLSKAISTLHKSPSIKQSIKVSNVLLDWGDSISKQYPREFKKAGYKMGCKKGCSYCCHENIQVTVYEAISIISWITKNLDDEAIQNIKQRADKIRANSIFGLNDLDRWQRRLPCPCLDLRTNSCVIYSTRPLNCRIFASVSVRSCKDSFEDSDSQRLNNDLPVDFNLPAPKEELPSADILLDPALYISYTVLNASLLYFMDIFQVDNSPGSPRNLENLQYDFATYIQMELSNVLSTGLNGDVNKNLKTLLNAKVDTDIS